MSLFDRITELEAELAEAKAQAKLDGLTITEVLNRAEAAEKTLQIIEVEALGAESPESETVVDAKGNVHDNPHYGNPYAQENPHVISLMEDGLWGGE